jgi:hypothetical protein
MCKVDLRVLHQYHAVSIKLHGMAVHGAPCNHAWPCCKRSIRSCIRKWSNCQSSDACMMSSLMMITPLLRYLSGQRCSGHVLLKPKELLQHRLPCFSMIGRRRAGGCEINSRNTYLLTPSRTIVFTIMCYKRKSQEQARNAGQQTH